jgi:MoxR-like ATPase
MTNITQITSAPVQQLTPSPNFSRQVEFIQSIYRNMLAGGQRSILIGGETGIGKTSFVKQFSKMLGIPAIVVEVPHIVEEELINIPYVIYDVDGQTHFGNSEIELEKEANEEGVKDLKVVLAKSWLASHLAEIKKIGDTEYQTHVETKLGNVDRQLIDAINEEDPNLIGRVRSMFDRILFIDEYFRKTSPTIRNILRNILNGQIGNDNIPAGTYVLYASNLRDVEGSLDQQLGNESYDTPEFIPPSAAEWLNWTVGDAKNVNWHPDVVEAFKETVKDEDMGFRDLQAKVRTSPRRWTEIMLYINSLYPFESPREAGIAEMSLRKQFEGQQGKISSAYKTLAEILKKLIKKSGHTKIPRVTSDEWKDVLLQNVMVKQKLGSAKKYIPVIQGAPGIGKTSVVKAFEEPPYNMRVIPVLASTLTVDSVIGLPTTKLRDKEGKKLKPEEMETRFSEPPLYHEIMRKTKEADAGYYAELKILERQEELGGKTAEEVFREYKNQQFQYVIFFDELNRVKSANVFNSLRRLILEKEFNSRYKLPDECIVVGAMNPTDIAKSTAEMTDHFRDAIDLIDVEPSWPVLLNILKTNATNQLLNRPYPPAQESIDVAYKIIEGFPEKFSSKYQYNDEGVVTGEVKNHEFYISAKGVSSTFYIDPRAYTDTFKNIAVGYDIARESMLRKINKGQDLSDEEIKQQLTNGAFNALNDFFNNLFGSKFKGTEPAGFREAVRDYIESVVDIDLTVDRTRAGIGSIIDHALSSQSSLGDDDDFHAYMASFNTPEFVEDFESYLDKKLNLTKLGSNDENDQAQTEFVLDFLTNQSGGESLFKIVQLLIEGRKSNNYEYTMLDEVSKTIDSVYRQAMKTVGKVISDESVENLIDSYEKIHGMITNET